MGVRGPDVPPAPIAPRPRRAFRPPSLAALTEPAAFRLRVAIAMAALSLASAYITHIATERAADAAGLESIAAQQAAEEQQVDQQIDAIVAQDLRLTARLDAHLQSYRRNQREAAAVRAANPERAVELDLAAQAEADQVRHLYPFFRGNFPNVTGNATYDAQAARDSLRGTDWRVFRASSGSTRLLADARRGTATAIVVSVVVLVLSLFLLTIGHLRGGRPGLAIAAGGAVASLAAIIWFAVHAPEATPPLIAIAGVGLLLVAGARLIARRRWLSEQAADETIVDLVDVPAAGGPAVAAADPAGPPVSRQARVVAVLIALATLLGSGVGYLQAWASGRSDASAWEARNLAVEAIGALRAAEEQLAVDTETYELALGQRVSAWSAAQQVGYADAARQPVLAARLRDEERALLELADATAARSGIAGVLGETGVHDPRVLQTLRSRIWESPARIAALQDAANAAAAAWGTQAALYVSVLAWLAVAAYLLGLSLVFQERRVQRVLTAVGLLLLVASLTRTVVVAIEPEPVGRESATLAADAYAAGFVALAADDLEIAEARFTEAIEHRPDFAMARRERSQSIIRSGAAQRTGTRVCSARLPSSARSRT